MTWRSGICRKCLICGGCHYYDGRKIRPACDGSGICGSDQPAWRVCADHHDRKGGSARCWQVSIDEMSGVDLAMEHLFSLGHRHIAMIGGRNHVKSTYVKRMRYRTILRSHGITFRERYIPESDYDIEGGYQCMNRLFEMNRTMPTAVMAINDFSAVGSCALSRSGDSGFLRIWRLSALTTHFWWIQ